MKKSRKDDVIYSANCIIRKAGYSNLSFSQIANTLDITRENVHHYFKKKELLGIACLNSMQNELDDKFQNILKKKIPADKKLQEYFKIYKTQQNEKEDCPIVSLLSEYELLPSSMQEKIKQLIQIEQKNMQIILDEGLKEKIFYFKIDSEKKAKAIISLLKGAVNYSKIYNNFNEMCKYILDDLKS